MKEKLRSLAWFALVGLAPLGLVFLVWAAVGYFQFQRNSARLWTNQEQALMTLLRDLEPGSAPEAGFPRRRSTLSRESPAEVPEPTDTASEGLPLGRQEGRREATGPRPATGPSAQESALRQTLVDIDRRFFQDHDLLSDPIWIGIMDFRGRGPVLFPSWDEMEVPLFQGVREARQNLMQTGRLVWHVYSWHPFGQGRVLVAVSRIPPAPLPLVIVFLGGAAAWLFVVFRRPHLLEWGFSGQIAGRVARVFTLATGLPCLVMILAGTLAISNKAAFDLHTLSLVVAEKLRILDSLILDEYERLNATMDRLFVQADAATDPGSRLALLRGLPGMAGIRRVSVFSGEGALLADMGGAGSGPVDLSSPPPVATGPAGQSAFLYSLAKDADVLVRQDRIPARGVAPAVLVRTELDQAGFEAAFGRRIQMEYRRSGEMLLEISLGNLSPDGRHVAYDDRHLRLLPSLIREVGRKRVTITRHQFREDGPHYWVCMPGIQVRHHCLIGAVSLVDLEGQTRVLLLAMVILTGTFILVSAIGGRSLATQFLTPLGRIGEGVRAIARRDVSFRIPETGDDEITALSRLLNKVIGDMKDLQVAAVVQEALFPSAGLRVGDCEIVGRSRPMIDIGGDYFDYFPLDGTGVVGLIGDVSGHGVPAALIMGLAKGAFALDPGQEVGSFLSRFNRLLVETFRRRKMMTLFLFHLDTTTHVFTFSNAGHCYPYHYQAATGHADFLSCPGKPLGVSLTTHHPTHRLTLAAGDSLLFFTDGLAESTDAEGQPIGYDVVAAWFAGCARHPAAEILNRMQEQFDGKVSGQTPSDDVTLMILQRDAAPDCRPGGPAGT